MHVPMKSSGWLGQLAYLVFLFPELACPCIFWEGSSLLFSSHNPRLLLDSRPPSSYRVQPIELSGHGAPHQAESERDRGQCQAHALQSEGSLQSLLPRGCGCVRWGGGSCPSDPLFFCSQERESSPTSHFHQHIQQQPRAEDGENVPILEYDNSPRGAAGANVASGFLCVMQSLSFFVKENSFLDVP